MAVLPELQKQGIGTQLVKRGLEELRLGSVAFVMTLGYPAYFLRFGFAPPRATAFAVSGRGSEGGLYGVATGTGAWRKARGHARYGDEFTLE